METQPNDGSGFLTMLSLEDVKTIKPTDRRLRQGRKRKPCVYCGGQAVGDTMDHVFAETLFAPVPLNAITVHACKACNGTKAVGDDILHVVVHASPDAFNLPASSEHFGEIARSIPRRQSPAALAAWRAYRLRKQVDPLRLGGPHVPYSIDIEALDATLQMMVRGLFYAVNGRILPADCPVDVLPQSQQEGSELIYLLLSDPGHFWGQRGFSNGAENRPDVEWIMTSDSLFGDEAVMCLLLFNGGVFYIGVTGSLARPLDVDEPDEPDSILLLPT